MDLFKAAAERICLPNKDLKSLKAGKSLPATEIKEYLIRGTST